MQAGGCKGNRRNPAWFAARVTAALAGGALLALASWRVATEAYAEHLYASGEIDRVRRAAELAPGRALYWSGLADLLDRTGEDPLPALREAARLSPADDTIWIRLGLHEELAGRLAEAETGLIQAARVSRKYLPRWTLANFYYRHGRLDAFWKWAREALAISHGDRTALWELCWSLRAEPEFLLEHVVPDRRDVQADYASFLVARGRFRAAAALYERLAGEAQPAELNRFLEATDRLLESGEHELARSVWNALCRRRLLPYRPLDGRAGPVVTNADFSRWTLGRGFDWRVREAPGAVVAPGSQGGWRILLSGSQPEQCEILSQPLLLEPGRTYRLVYGAPASFAGGAPHAASGLRWQVVARGGRVLADAAVAPADEAARRALEFRIPPGGGAAELKLVYARPSGSVRAQGVVELAPVAIEPAGG